MSQKKNACPKTITFLLLCCILLAGCKKATPSPPTPTPESFTETPRPTNTPILTQTPTKGPTLSPTATSFPTITPSPTLEIFEFSRSLSLTPLPPIRGPIQDGNVDQVNELATWGTGSPNEIALSPNGEILAVATNIGSFLYGSTYFQNLTFLPTTFAINAIAFSPDDQLIALGQYPVQIDIHNRINYGQMTQLFFPDWNIQGNTQSKLFFTPDNTLLIHMAQSSERLYIDRWETTSWEPIDSFSVEAGSITFLNPNLSLVGILTENALVLQSLLQPGESQRFPLPIAEPDPFWNPLREGSGEIVPASFGDFVLINTGSTIAFWHLLEESFAYRLEDYPSTLPNPCEEVPNTCLNWNNGFSWDCSMDRGDLKPIEIIALTPDNLRLFISKNIGGSELRRATDGLLLWEMDAHYTKLTFSRNSEFLYGVLPDGTIEKRATIDGVLINVLKEHPNQLYEIDFSPDGSIMAAGYSDGWIRVYATLNGQMLGVLDGTATSLQLSPDGQLLAAGLNNGTVRIFELNTGRFYDLGSGHLATVSALTFSSDGQRLWTGSADCTVGLWDLSDRYRVQNIKPDNENPFQITALERDLDDTKQYFCGMQKNGLFIFEGAERQQVLLPSQRGFKDMALSPSGDILGMTGTNTWLLPVLPSSSLPEMMPLTSQSVSDGLAVTFTADGSVLIMASQQDLVFWSVPDGNEITTLRRSSFPIPKSEPVALTVSPNGSLLALGSQDGLIHIFGIPGNPID